jgi:hypothetical protein
LSGVVNSSRGVLSPVEASKKFQGLKFARRYITFDRRWAAVTNK